MTHIILRGPEQRYRAMREVQNAAQDCVVRIEQPKRSNAQNDLMWALLTDIAQQKPQGRDYPKEVWKSLFMAMMGCTRRWEPALDGDGVVDVGFKSSRLSVQQMSDLIEQIYAYGAENGVQFSEGKL